MEYWTQSLNFGICTDIIYLDIHPVSEAFDTVSHAQLLSRLKAYSTVYWRSAFETDYSLFIRKETMCMLFLI